MPDRNKTELGALVALFTGAMTIGAASILVRLSQTGPTATAFWRGCLALPLLGLWALLEPASKRPPGDVPARGASLRWVAAGLFFAADLALWNWSLLLTSVAASTLEANLAPLFVTFFLWLFYRERPTARFIVATAFALGGMLLMVSPKFGQSGSAFVGDALALGAAAFFGAYILAVASLRARYGTGIVMFISTLVFALALLPLALTQKFVPDTLSGWATVAGCALAAQVFGQGLVAYALAHLRPTFGSLGLLVQVLGATTAAWLVLGERLSPIQIVGALVILGSTALARSTTQSSKPAPEAAPVAVESLGVLRD
jgi:drug/metabolite transporter (DMT)-like permease